MSGPQRNPRAEYRLTRMLGRAIAVISIVAAGCATAPTDTPLLQRLDENSGATVTTLPEPMSFYREEPMLAANSRDYVYLGPVEVNRGGRRQYMLWAAYRSTIDRIGGRGSRAPESAYLMLDGVPMELLRARRTAELGVWLYDSPVSGGETVMYRVTRGQLLAIAGAQEIVIVAEDQDNVAVEFEAWRESDSDFRRFSRYLVGDPTDRMTLAHE